MKRNKTEKEKKKSKYGGYVIYTPELTNGIPNNDIASEKSLYYAHTILNNWFECGFTLIFCAF